MRDKLFTIEDKQHHIHGESDGRFVAKDSGDASSIEKHWEENDIKTTEAFRSKVMPKIEKKFNELSSKLKIDLNWFRESVEMGDSPEAIIDQLTAESDYVFDAFTNADSLSSLIQKFGSRETDHLGDDETDVEDAVGEWLRKKLQGVIVDKKDDILATIPRKKKTKELSLTSHAQAKWYNTLLGRCLLETTDIDEAVRAADLAFSIQSVPLAIEDAQHHLHAEKGEHGGQFVKKGESESKSALGKTIDSSKKAYYAVHEAGEKAFHSLPEPVQKAISTVVAVAFSGWTASQSLAERISEEKGSTPEQAKKIRSILAAWDMVAFKPMAMATAPLGGMVAAATWIVPPITGVYLLHSTVRHPIATFRAASGLVKDFVGSVRDKVEFHTARLSIETNEQTALVDALENHDWDDWYSAILHASLQETGDIAKAIEVANRIFSQHPNDESEPSKNDADELFGDKKSLSVNALFAHDIFNRNAQGILNRSIAAIKKMNRSARIDLEKSLKTEDPTELSRALMAFIQKYRVQLTDILTTTQLASLLEGAQEVAKKIPTIPMFPGAVSPPATLEPVKAVDLLNKLKVMPTWEREAEIYKLPADQQSFIRQGLLAQQHGGIQPPTTFVPSPPSSGEPERIHYPIIDEAAQSLAAKNVMTRQQFDSLDAAARQKAFTVAHVESLDTINRIRNVMSEVVRDGVDVQTFRERVLVAMDEGTFMSDWHMETVLRVNVQTAFSDGQMAILQHPFVKSGFPYASYEAIHDDRARHNHLELEKLGIQGTNIYRINDPVFQMFRPPWDWCLPADSIIRTKRGLVRIDDIVIGDEVLTHMGRFRSVRGTNRSEGVSELVAVQLESGAFCRATSEHPFFTKRGWIEASRLNISDQVYQIPNATAPHLIVLKVDNGLEIEDFNNGRVSVFVGPMRISLNLNTNGAVREKEIKPEWKGLLVENKLDLSFGESGGKCFLVTAHSPVAVNVLCRIEPDRLAATGDHLRTNFGTARRSMDAVGISNLFDSVRVETVMNTVGVSDTPYFHSARLENPSDSSESHAGYSRDIGNADFLVDIISDDGFDSARITGKTCLGVIEIGGIAFWLFSHNCNCNPIASKVKSINRIPWTDSVYNFSVDEDESYIADGIVTHNCDRCSWIPMTVRMAASKGIEEAKQWLETGIEPNPPAFVAMPDFRPPPGFQRSLTGMPLSLLSQWCSYLD